jgi:hypothetical protein
LEHTSKGSAFQCASFKKNLNNVRRLLNGFFYHTAFKLPAKAIPPYHSVFEIVENGCGASANETRNSELALWIDFVSDLRNTATTTIMKYHITPPKSSVSFSYKIKIMFETEIGNGGRRLAGLWIVNVFFNRVD